MATCPHSTNREADPLRCSQCAMIVPKKIVLTHRSYMIDGNVLGAADQIARIRAHEGGQYTLPRRLRTCGYCFKRGHIAIHCPETPDDLQAIYDAETRDRILQRYRNGDTLHPSQITRLRNLGVDISTIDGLGVEIKDPVRIETEYGAEYEYDKPNEQSD